MSYDKFLSSFDSMSPMMGELLTLSNFVQSKIIEISPEEKTTKLYHYTSAQGLEGIVSNANLWATDYRFLNDSREMKDGLDVVYKALIDREEVVLQELAIYLKEHSENLTEFLTPYIISFCSKHDLLSQWRAYSNQSEGYCIEFDLSDSRLSTYQNSTVIICNFLPVIYDGKLKLKIVNFIIDELSKTIKKYNIDNDNISELNPENKGMIIGLLQNVFQIPLLTFKDEGFSEEKEWRAIFLANSVQNEKLRKFRTTGGTFVPYVESIFLQNDEENLFQRKTLPIRSVCLPPAAGNTTRKGLELFLHHNGFQAKNKVSVLNSAIPLRNQKNINW
ncbi:DUF2971 domain-containing protein [Paraglaciecola sp. 2405UD69-4]|uniref:DUF2971 domain-containing protein n=1 Tax=Paraglaciecola sp. 2405UD69-4 TaxID=3391836 RepID=UPI0039C8DE65